MAQQVKLRRSSVAGNKPTTAQLELGELAINTNDGKLYFEKSSSLGESVQEIIVTDAWNTGSINISGSVTVSGSINATSFTGSLFGTASYAANALSASYALVSTSASYAATSTSASYANVATSSSYANNATSASYALTSTSASYATTSSFAQNAQDILIYVKNVTGAQISKGTVVRISGSTGDNALISTASYESDGVSANTLGITYQDIPNDNFGYVITEGTLIGINTNAFSAGQLLYLGATGSIIGTAPIAPLHAVRLGQVLRVQINNGSIYVRIDNGYELGELHDVVDTTTTSSYGDLLVKSGSVWINSKQLTGSYSITGSLNATSFTGSLFGTASYSSNSLSSSYAVTSTSASYALSSSYASQATSASYANVATSASYAASSSYANNFTVAGTLTAQTLVVQTVTSSIIYSSGSNTFGSSLSNNQIFTGSMYQSGSVAVFLSNVAIGTTSPSYTLDVNGTGRFGAALTINGTSVASTVLTLQESVTLPTALAIRNRNSNQTWGLAVDTATVDDKNFGIYNITNPGFPFIINATTSAATFSAGVTAASFTGSLLGTASYAANALSASYALNTTSASYAATSTSASYALVSTSASYAATSTSASYSNIATTASYALTSTSASYAATASYADNFTVAGTLTAQTLIVQTITSSIIYSSGSNQLGDATSDIQLLIGTTNITGSLQVTGSVTISGSISNPGPNPSVSNEIFGIGAYPLLTGSARQTTVMGAYALGSSTGIRDSVVIGYAAMFLTTGSAITGSIAIGQNALYNQQGGLYNVAIGVNAMQGLTGIANTGDRNLAIGTSALLRNTTGTRNNSIGDTSLSNNSVGSYNVANGNRTLQANTSGSYNVGVGYDALFTQTSASNNTAIGTQALRDVTTGFNNTAIGYDSGRGITTGQYNTILGANVTGLTAGLSNNVIIADSQGNIRAQHDSSVWSLRTSTTITGSLDVSAGITGSLLGTASYATNALTASYYGGSVVSASYAATASYVLSAVSASYSQNSTSASYAQVAVSASYFSGSISTAISASYAATASYAVLATTASYFSGSLSAPGSTTQVLYNNGGTIDGASGLVYSGSNVGIGVTTPQKVLDVVVSANDFSTAGATGLSVGQWAGVHFGYRENNNNYRKSAIVFERTDLTSNNAQGKVHILNGPQAGAGSATLADSKLTIDEAGNVGIGTTSPSYKLDVNGTSAFRSDMYVTNTSTYWYNGTSYFEATNSSNVGILKMTNNSSPIALQPSGGNVGIGTTSPSAKLDIKGDLIVSSSLIANQNTASLGSGAQTISTNATSSYTAAFYNYTVASGSNARAGQVTAVWNGGSIQYTDVSTTDIGSTLAVTFTASLSGANVQLTTVLPTSGWTVKTLANLI
jgi:hypothetical protein